MPKLTDYLRKGFYWVLFIISAALLSFYAPIYMRRRSRKESLKEQNTDRVKVNERSSHAEQNWTQDAKDIDKERNS